MAAANELRQNEVMVAYTKSAVNLSVKNEKGALYIGTCSCTSYKIKHTTNENVVRNGDAAIVMLITEAISTHYISFDVGLINLQTTLNRDIKI